MISINPGFVFGPVLSSRDDATSVKIIKSLLNGSEKEIDANLRMRFIDIRDVVDAHIKTMEDPNAEGRYICCYSKGVFKVEIAKILSKNFPNYPITTKVINENSINQIEDQYDNSKLEKLLGKLIPQEKTLIDMVNSFFEFNIIEKK